MTAVAELGSEPASKRADSRASEEDKNLPSEAALLDVLYEVLAQGAAPKGELSVETVQRFLHEHARNKKPLAELLAFFTQHGLPTDAAAYGSDPALRELAQGLKRERSPISATFDLDAEAAAPLAPHESGPVRRMIPAQVDGPTEDTAPRAAHLAQLSSAAAFTSSPAVFERPSVQKSNTALSYIAMACAAVLGLTAFMTYRHAQELEAKLTEARLQQRSTDVALMAIERRAETLRGALDQSETARQTLAGRFDDFVVAEAQARAAEATALERILGKRFETLRDKALNEALSGAAH